MFAAHLQPFSVNAFCEPGFKVRVQFFAGVAASFRLDKVRAHI